MFLKHTQRERDYVQREKKKSVFEKNQSTARVPFDIPERERDASIVRKSRERPARWPSKQTERETIFKKKRTVRVSLCPIRRRRRLSDGGGSVMTRAVVVVAILQRREKIHRRCRSRSFGGHFCREKNKSPGRMLTRLSCEKARETWRARECARGFFL